MPTIRITSCRRRGDKWLVAMNKWQDITDMEVSKGLFGASLQFKMFNKFATESLDLLSEFCR
jgi:phosphoribosylformimino-5-aminoimidazole carboxamide ribotide isomerase